MPEVYDSACPLCDDEACFEHHKVSFRFFECDTCGDFVISRRACEELKVKPNRKAKLSEASAKLKGSDLMLEITFVVGEGLHLERVPLAKYQKRQ